MLLGAFTVIIMLAIAYAFLREGLFTAFTMFFNVFLSGLVAFNFFEPLAERLQTAFTGTFLLGYEDMLCLVGLFCLTLGILRLATNTFANSVIEYPEMLQRVGGALFGLATGYLFCGFFLCCLQTLPWHRNFMDFQPGFDSDSPSALRDVLPPDRVWLATMCRAGAYAFFDGSEDPAQPPGAATFIDRRITFDKDGTFELRYARYRRYTDQGPPLTYAGELTSHPMRRAGTRP